MSPEKKIEGDSGVVDDVARILVMLTIIIIIIIIIYSFFLLIHTGTTLWM
jgi:hypothetical protein